jgi:hypothetical protein
MKTSLVLTCIAVLMAGCHDKGTKIEYLDRVYTVKEFQAQPDTIAKVLATCSNDPGTYLQDANCINANEARVENYRLDYKKKQIAELRALGIHVDPDGQ